MDFTRTIPFNEINAMNSLVSKLKCKLDCRFTIISNNIIGTELEFRIVHKNIVKQFLYFIFPSKCFVGLNKNCIV